MSLSQKRKKSAVCDRYHGDPVRTGGALTFYEFGRDLIGLLEATGFDVVLHETVRPEIQGGYVAVFETVRR